MRHVRKLPTVLNIEEVGRLLEAARPLKDKAALGASYGAGLRMSEVVELRIGDIDSTPMPRRAPPRLHRPAKSPQLTPMLKNVSLSAVRAFEAAARNGSFRAAALELGLSPSAVSHAIIALEQTLGTSLFERTGRLVRLTRDGEILMRHVGAAFEHLRIGVEAITNQGPQLLRLHSAPSFAAQCLTPRLAGFLATHPEIGVRLAASTEYVIFSSDECDADIVYGPVRGEGLEMLGLGEETVTPLCSPTLAVKLHTPKDLYHVALIQSDRKQVRWPDWFAANDLPTLFGGTDMRFDRSFLAIAAAADGLGVALESTRLAERELASGRLVAPLIGSARNIQYVGHHLVFPKAGAKRRIVRIFAEWLSAELAQAAPLT